MSPYLGVRVECKAEKVTLHFDQEIADLCLRGETTPVTISDAMYYALQECTIAPDVAVADDYYSLTFTLRHGILFERAIGEVLAIVCDGHPSFKTAIVWR